MSKDFALIMSTLHPYLSDSVVQSMRQYAHHGSISTYEHSLKVALVSYEIVKKLRLKNIDIDEMLVGAILHDLYLYDWHVTGRNTSGSLNIFKLHGFTHPAKALENAMQYYHLTKKEKNIISSHMFPLTLTKIPLCKEAVVVCLADKCCAMSDYFRSFKVRKNA